MAVLLSSMLSQYGYIFNAASLKRHVLIAFMEGLQCLVVIYIFTQLSDTYEILLCLFWPRYFKAPETFTKKDLD